MIKDKISSQEIIDLVSSKALVSKRAAEDFLKVMIATIEDALMAGESVKIKNLGTFKLQWNEPRKSVNIQTGEEIILSGYHKVSFTPDAILKDLVNEPFAHLEPIELEQETIEPIQEDTDVVLDPLRIFTEQASEIKDLISEIQSLSPKAKPVAKEKKTEVKIEVEKIEVEKIEIEKNDLVESKIISAEEIVSANPIETVIVSEDEKISQVPVELNKVSEVIPEFNSTPFLDKIEPPKKRKTWIWVLSTFLLICCVGSGLYFLYPPAKEYTDNTIHNFKTSVTQIPENKSISEVLNAISGWFRSSPKKASITESIIVPKDTSDVDSIGQNEPTDSLQMMFDNARVYKKYIASERIKAGSRLTLISKRYYGSKDFWVYIYEANKEKITNPDQIAKGTLIRIPKLDPRLIDATNPRCIKKAKELHDIYVK